MSQEPSNDPRQILARNIEALNARNLDAYLTNQHPDTELVVPGGATLRGRDQVRQATEASWTAFPDGRLEFGEQVLGDDTAATQVIFRGTNTGPLATPNGTIEPTGLAVESHFVSMLWFKDGMVLAEHVYQDQLDLMAQLGLLPSPPAAA